MRNNNCISIPAEGGTYFKIYRFREKERRAGEKRKIHKIYKISLACEQVFF